MKTLLYLLLLSTLSFAESLEYLLLKLKSQNLSLQAEKEAIMIAKEEIALADSWQNPTLVVGANDLLLDDITARDKEPMQTHYLTLSQKIPLGGKIALQSDIAQTQKMRSDSAYHDSLLKLSSQLEGFAYRVAIVDKKIALLGDFEKNVKRLKRLHTKRFSIGKSRQGVIEESIITLKKLQIKKRKFMRIKKRLLDQIAALVFEDISSVELSLEMDKTPDIDLKNHPIMIDAQLAIQKSHQAVQLARARKIPDMKLGVGYFQREGRSDYLALNAGFSLPVRGREERKISQAILEHSRAKKSLQALQFNLARKVDILLDAMQEAKANYQTLKREILPKKRHIQKLLEQEIFTKNASSTTLLININEMIALEFEALDEMAHYFDAYAKLVYFEGELS